MKKRSLRRHATTRYRAVTVAGPSPEPVRIEITPQYYGRLARQAARERTTVAELLRPTAIAVIADRLAHPTDTTAPSSPDDRDTSAT